MKAAAITVVVSALAGPAILLAFAFSLSVMAVASLVLMRFSVNSAKLTIEPRRVRTFKGREVGATLYLEGFESRWTRPDSVTLTTPYGLACETIQTGLGTSRLVLTPAYAGKFGKLVVTVRTADVLGLFARSETLDLTDFAVESLPRGLTMPMQAFAVSPLVAGESPAGRRGGGQEFYSVEEYHSGNEGRDILWRKAARSTDESIPVRIREANVKKKLTFGFIVGWETEEERAKRMDLASEAVARLCRISLGVGTAVELLHLKEGGIEHTGAARIEQVGDAIVSTWEQAGFSGDPSKLIQKSDLVILGPDEAEDRAVVSAIGSKPSLLVTEKQPPSGTRRGAYWFTGTEDLSRLVRQVLET